MENKKKESQKSGKDDKKQRGNLAAEIVMLGLEIFRFFPEGPEIESDLKKAAEKAGLERLLLSELEYSPIGNFYDDLLENQKSKIPEFEKLSDAELKNKGSEFKL